MKNTAKKMKRNKKNEKRKNKKYVNDIRRPFGNYCHGIR